MIKEYILKILNIFLKLLIISCFIFFIIYIIKEIISTRNLLQLFIDNNIDINISEFNTAIIVNIIGLVLIFFIIIFEFVNLILCFKNFNFKKLKSKLQETKLIKLKTQLSKLNKEEQSDTTKNEG